MFVYRNGVSVDGISGSVYGNISSGLLNSFKSASIHHQIPNHRKSGGSKRFDSNGIAVLKTSHMQLACGRQSIGTVRSSINLKRTGSANSFSTIVVEMDRFFVFIDQLLV